MKLPIEITGAYGRTYKTKKAFLEDWKGNKDFQMDNGQYCSIRDIELMQNQSDTIYIMIRNKPVYVVRYGEIV